MLDDTQILVLKLIKQLLFKFSQKYVSSINLMHHIVCEEHHW